MTLAVITAVVVVTAFANKLNLGYQFKFFSARDNSVKAPTEMLGQMRMIKLQAWEETFGGKVLELRRVEVGWLKKVILFVCATNVVYSSGPIAMTVLVFGTYLTTGGELDAGKVFTATAFFCMLEGPMSNFPQTMVMSMQALVLTYNVLPSLFHQTGLLVALVRACTFTWYQSQEVLSSRPG